MKKLTPCVVGLIGPAALAADMAVKALPPAALYNWTGSYLSVGGYSWGNTSGKWSFHTATAKFVASDFAFALNQFDSSFCQKGGFSGIQAGHNWQLCANSVVGFETADIQIADTRGQRLRRFNCLDEI